MSDLTDATLAHLGVTPEMVEVATDILLDEERGEFGSNVNREFLAKAILGAAMACASAPQPIRPCRKDPTPLPPVDEIDEPEGSGPFGW